MFAYRLKKDNYRSWAVMERVVVPEIGSKTGKPTKNAGEVKWMPVKYPGNLLQAAQSLLALAIEDDVEVGSIDELIAVVQEAEEKVLMAISKWREEANCPICTREDNEVL